MASATHFSFLYYLLSKRHCSLWLQKGLSFPVDIFWRVEGPPYLLSRLNTILLLRPTASPLSFPLEVLLTQSGHGPLFFSLRCYAFLFRQHFLRQFLSNECQEVTLRFLKGSLAGFRFTSCLRRFLHSFSFFYLSNRRLSFHSRSCFFFSSFE